MSEEFGLRAAELAFLPLGYDVRTAVYRLATVEGAVYFVKVRRGGFEAVSLELPRWLKAQGVGGVIAPLATRAGQAWAELGEHQLAVYPFVEGQDGYEKTLSEGQWHAFGAALRGLHTAQAPAKLRGLAAKETFSSQGREQVRRFQKMVEQVRFDEPVASRLGALMREKREEIRRVVTQAERLAAAVQARGMEAVLCHGDIHPGNLLIAEDGSLYIVDWDEPVLAPKERDLALIGGCKAWSDAQQAVQFYQGYGETEVDPTALAYFRYERIVQDMAEFCQQLLLSEEGGEDREQGFQYFASNFLPGGEIDLAKKLEPELRL